MLYPRISKKSPLLGVIIAALLCQSMATNIMAQSKQSSIPQFDSVLNTSWAAYKQQFIQPDGRVVDWMNEGNTTSEGQSYAMLRAVWMNDAQTFHICFGWSLANLRVRNDKLFA